MSELETQVTRVLEGYKAAVLAKDDAALIELYDPNVRVFDIWGAWSFEGAPAWRNAVRQWFASLGDESVAVDMDEVRISGGQEAAIASAIVSYTAVSSAGRKLRSMQNRLTWGLVRSGDAWKIIHEHTSAPVNFDDQKVILQRKT